MSKQSLISAGVLGAALIAMPLFANSQGVEIGKAEFNNHCAVCHGANGTGNGPLAGMISTKVADLTMLRKSNNGVFPFNKVYEVIDGRNMVKGHGTRDMPVWGAVYNEQAPEWVGPYSAPADYAVFVRGRILALIGYIDTLQAK